MGGGGLQRGDGGRAPAGGLGARVADAASAIGKVGETRRYLVQFDRSVWRGANQDPTQAWSATVDFQWHPELPMRPDDRTDNPGGFQVLGYSASSDTPDQRRQ